MPLPASIHQHRRLLRQAVPLTETGANLGSLGVFEAKFLMRHRQANAKAFDKYGA